MRFAKGKTQVEPFGGRGLLGSDHMPERETREHEAGMGPWGEKEFRGCRVAPDLVDVLGGVKVRQNIHLQDDQRGRDNPEREAIF